MESQTTNNRWWEEAACRGLDPALFHPEDNDTAGHTSRIALTVCRVCPVNGPCLEDALLMTRQEGIWGGLTVKQRLRIKKGRRCSAST